MLIKRGDTKRNLEAKERGKWRGDRNYNRGDTGSSKDTKRDKIRNELW